MNGFFHTVQFHATQWKVDRQHWSAWSRELAWEQFTASSYSLGPLVPRAAPLTIARSRRGIAEVRTVMVMRSMILRCSSSIVQFQSCTLNCKKKIMIGIGSELITLLWNLLGLNVSYVSFYIVFVSNRSSCSTMCMTLCLRSISITCPYLALLSFLPRRT